MYNYTEVVFKIIGISVPMPRRDILKITEEILKLLSDKKEHSVQNISTKLKSQWKTTIKCLNFLKKINLVKLHINLKDYLV